MHAAPSVLTGAHVCAHSLSATGPVERSVPGPATSSTPSGARAAVRPTPRRRVLRAAQRRGRGDHIDVVMLGTGGGPPVVGRRNTSTAVIVDGRVYLVDCGRGSLTSFAELDLRLGDIAAILLTHLHADHTGELFNYLLFAIAPGGAGAAPSDPIDIVGPGPADTIPTAPRGVASPICPDHPTPGTSRLLAHSIAAHASHLNVAKANGAPDVRDLLRIRELTIDGREDDVDGVCPGLCCETWALGAPSAAAAGDTAPAMKPHRVFEDDRVAISTVLVPHGGMFPSLAYRFDTDAGSVVVSGDTAVSDNLVALAAGADLLLHEVMDADALRAAGMSPDFVDGVLRTVHTDVADVGDVAHRSGVNALALHHFVPAAAPVEAWEGRGVRGFDGEVVVGDDLLTLAVGGAA